MPASSRANACSCPHHWVPPPPPAAPGPGRGRRRAGRRDLSVGKKGVLSANDPRSSAGSWSRWTPPGPPRGRRGHSEREADAICTSSIQLSSIVDRADELCAYRAAAVTAPTERIAVNVQEPASNQNRQDERDHVARPRSTPKNNDAQASGSGAFPADPGLLCRRRSARSDDRPSRRRLNGAAGALRSPLLDRLLTTWRSAPSGPACRARPCRYHAFPKPDSGSRTGHPRQRWGWSR